MQALAAFEKWVVNFIGLIHPPAYHIHAQYIIITTYYLTSFVKSALVKDCTTDMTI